MRRLLLGLVLLGSIVLSGNEVMAAPRLLEVSVSCDLLGGTEVDITFSGYPATSRWVQLLVQGFQSSHACVPGTLRIEVQPLP